MYGGGGGRGRWQASASGTMREAVREVLSKAPILLVGLVQALFEGKVG